MTNGSERGDETEMLEKALEEANTVFLVMSVTENTNESEMEDRLAEAQNVAKQTNPAVWRAFLIRQPNYLSRDLKQLLWDGVVPKVAVVLSLGTGTERTVRASYEQTTDIDSNLKLFTAFGRG